MCLWGGLGDSDSAGVAEGCVFVGFVVVGLGGAVCLAAGSGEFLAGVVGAYLVCCGW